MSITYQTVEIDGQTYDAYVDVASADTYLNADPLATAWRLLDDDGKGRAIVLAGRVLDIQNWQGTKTDEDQSLAWPRTGVSGVDDDVIPTAIVNAAIELANASASGIDIANFTTTATTERRIKAGSVEVENFRALGIAAYGLPLPRPAWMLIAPYLAGAGAGLAGASSGGTCGRTINCPGFGLNSGF